MPTDEERDAARQARLRQELADEGFPFGATATDDLVIEELTHARYVKVHEGIFPNYGALIGPQGTTPDGAALKDGDPPTAMRKFADGESSFILRRADEPASISLVHHALADERDIVDLCAATESVFVQRLPDGTVTVTTKERILVNEGYTWRARPVASTRTHDLNDVLQLSAIGMRPLFSQILDFACHQLSPEHIGATLVLDMQGDTIGLHGSLGSQGNKPPFDVNLGSDGDARAMVAFLRVVDGACLVASDGQVIRTETKLHYSQEAIAKIRPDGGTRHSSAKWFSYDQKDVVVIVVSADGPVSLYSSGVRIAVFDKKPAHMLTPREVSLPQRAAFTQSVIDMNCGNCGTDVRVDVRSHPDSDTPHGVECPVCEGELETLPATQVIAYPAKPWFRPAA